jgi:hypothetical protein
VHYLRGNKIEHGRMIALGVGLTARRLRGQPQSVQRQVQQIRQEQQGLSRLAAGCGATGSGRRSRRPVLRSPPANPAVFTACS